MRPSRRLDSIDMMINRIYWCAKVSVRSQVLETQIVRQRDTKKRFGGGAYRVRVPSSKIRLGEYRKQYEPHERCIGIELIFNSASCASDHFHAKMYRVEHRNEERNMHSLIIFRRLSCLSLTIYVSSTHAQQPPIEHVYYYSVRIDFALQRTFSMACG